MMSVKSGHTQESLKGLDMKGFVRKAKFQGVYLLKTRKEFRVQGVSNVVKGCQSLLQY